MHTLVLAAEACFEPVAASLAVHSYSAEEDADSDSVLADELDVAEEVYIVAVEPAAGVAWAGSARLVRSEVVPGAVFLVVADSVCCYLVQLALGSL